MASFFKKNTMAEGLKKLQKELQESYVAKVGIIGNKNGRTDGKDTNANIGAKHEFGIGVPQRSFLRMPITTKQKEIQAVLAKNIEKNNKISIKNGFEKMAAKGEAVVLEAFDTGGFGKWAKLSPTTIANKKVPGTSTILVDTVQLKKSITSKVEKKNASGK